MKRLGRSPLVWCAVWCAACLGCNGIAGISDLTTGDVDASSASDAGDAGDATITDATPADAEGDAVDAGPMLMDCAAPLWPLRVSVLSSASTAYTGVTNSNDTAVTFTKLDIGQTFNGCVPNATMLKLQGIPDNSDAMHQWGGVCPIGRECQFSVTTPIAMDIRLQ